MDRDEAKKEKTTPAPVRASLFPFAIVFPLLIIALKGCFSGGCQGALNAQSRAVRIAIEEGGWTEQNER